MKFLAFSGGMLGALFAGALASHAVAEPVVKGDIVVTDGYAEAMSTHAPVANGYLVVRNNGNQDDRLVAARSHQAGQVLIREMATNGDVIKMHEIRDGVPIPAHSTVALKRGGYQLVFTKVPEPFAIGRPVETVLVFEKAGEIALPLEVRGNEPVPTAHHAHGSDHSGH